MSHLSYTGQSKLDYCIECAVKHGQTSKVLMREALQRAISDGASSEGVKEKIQGIVGELSGLEDDTDSIENSNVKELNDITRELRKHIYSTKAEIGGADLSVLEDLKQKIDALVDQIYDVREQEEICVSCVDWLCYGNEECKKFLAEVAATGDKAKFFQAVEEAKKKDWVEEADALHKLKDYGKSASTKRREFLEEMKREVEAQQ